jgi:hypothetical protein
MNKKLLVAAASCWAVTGTLAFADTTFGSLPAATFGGTGNPNNAVEITTVSGINGDTVTLGLAAQQRYDNPVVTGVAGVYSATPGANAKGPSLTVGALWNFDFYANVAGNVDHPNDNVSTYSFKLYYDFDPAAGTPKSSLGVLNLNNANISVGGSPTTQTIQDSENLDFAFLAASIPGITTPPTGVTSFDPNASGEYSFILEVDQDGRELGESDITVDVNAVPDVSATAPLFALGLGGLGAFASRKNRRQATI